jgi:tetratricopeptide (TPR) repeat protein
VLKIDPADEAAVLAMAEIDLRSDHNVRKAKARLDAFLSDINPRSAAALALRAEVALQDEDPEDAMARIKAAEKARADHPEVLAVKAAACKLEDDKRCFKAALRTSTRRDPTDGRPLLRAAHYLEMAHRYPEVLDMLQLAIKRDPELWQAHAQLGMAKARLVQDEGALDHLLIAFRNDPYNVRTANQLNVLHDGVLKQMVTLDGPVVDLRVHRRHRKAFERTMLPFLQDSFDTLAKRYGGPAEQPLRVEVFPTTEQFSVRTVGLPRLGAHAVCFGHLITSRSPAEKPFNWKMVLHHELAHVWHIQQSGGRVPRWLTEGLAMMESTWADPRWEMVVDRRMYDRLRQRRLSSIRHFNLAFSQARSMSDIGNAYQQAAWLVRYLDEAYGFDKLRRLVAGHRKPGSRTPALIKQIYGKTAEAIDGEFAAWLGKQLVRYDKDFRPDVDLLADGWASRHGKAKAGGSKGADAKPAKPADPPGTPPGPTFKKASELDAFGKAIDAAIGHLKERDAVKAVEALDAVLEPYLPGQGPDGKPTAAAKKADQAACAALYLAMQSAKRARKGHPATDYAQALVDSQGGVCNGLHAHLFLAMDAAERAKREQSADAAGQLAAAKPHFERAHRLDPRDQETLRRWLELADAAEDRPEIRRLSRLLLAIAPHAVPPAQALGLAAWDDWAGEQLKLASEGKRPDATKVDPRQGVRGLAAATAQDVRSPLARALVRDMGDAARWLEEVTPHAWGAALFEARAHVVAGRLKPAFVPYRLAAERGQDARQRAIAWCELAVVATAAGSKADAAEASRRCQADAS